ncbi:MAG: alanine--tRNA ligase [Alphaproteobacteria bacterium]
MMKSHDIRQAFLSYFAKHGHTVVPSSPLVPHQDPSLLFTSAGMVPFKQLFTGEETRAYVRAASSQKCLRAGGKHNDLENVGYTPRHHTFFEMLGNFSFGDYFKEEAIVLAWELLTQVFQLPKERLWVTVYAEDEEAFELWQKVAGLSQDRILKISTSDNFWSMGDTGPCGPCSEIFYDHGDHLPGGLPGTPEQDGDRFVEIWNLVFMQYEQQAPDQRVNLPKPSIDTGMGLERIAAVLQQVHDNYETDVLKALVEASADLTRHPATGVPLFSHRIIADHLRAGCFLIADGVLPTNEGRGYVLRRILRRAMRHAYQLGAQDPLMPRLAPELITLMGAAYPELSRAQALIVQTLDLEERRFQQTLERGLRLLEEETQRLNAGQVLPGEVAFKLYDTYGFPVDLTESILREKQLSLDTLSFQDAMARQKAEARASWAGSGETATLPIYADLRHKHGSTEFLGYTCETTQAVVQALLKEGILVDKAGPGEQVTLLTNQTPFYGESGGQMGDTGHASFGKDGVVEIIQTRNIHNLYLHEGKIKTGTLIPSQDITLVVDSARRSNLRRNHSATHLLHSALRKCLGTHVTQKGSLVAPDKLRFDFSHPIPLTPQELLQVEQYVNQQIRTNTDVETRLMTPEQAIEQGALALFGEKYGEEVRVISMGDQPEAGPVFSVELCGGTHVRRTGDIGAFKIVQETGIASGVRRIEALTGEGVDAYLHTQERLVKDCANLLKTTPDSALPEKLAQILETARRFEKEASHLRQQLASGITQQTTEAKELLGKLSGERPVHWIFRCVEDLSSKEMKTVVDQMKQQVDSGIAVLLSQQGDKASVVVGISESLTPELDAAAFAKQAAILLGGQGGGGRRDLAQAGGGRSPDPQKFEAALKDQAKNLILN